MSVDRNMAEYWRAQAAALNDEFVPVEPWAKLRPEYEGYMERLTWRSDHYATRAQRAAFQMGLGFDALALRERAQRLALAKRDLTYDEVSVILESLSVEWRQRLNLQRAAEGRRE